MDMLVCYMTNYYTYMYMYIYDVCKKCLYVVCTCTYIVFAASVYSTCLHCVVHNDVTI